MIEDRLEALTLAVNRNTHALIAILQRAGAYPQSEPAAPEPRPAKGKKAQPVEAEVVTPPEPEAPTPEPATAPEPEPEAPATNDTPALSREEWISRITKRVKDAYTSAGPNLTAKKAEFESIRTKWGVAKVQELTDEQLPKFWEAIQSL